MVLPWHSFRWEILKLAATDAKRAVQPNEIAVAWEANGCYVAMAGAKRGQTYPCYPYMRHGFPKSRLFPCQSYVFFQSVKLSPCIGWERHLWVAGEQVLGGHVLIPLAGGVTSHVSDGNSS